MSNLGIKHTGYYVNNFPPGLKLSGANFSRLSNTRATFLPAGSDLSTLAPDLRAMQLRGSLTPSPLATDHQASLPIMMAFLAILAMNGCGQDSQIPVGDPWEQALVSSDGSDLFRGATNGSDREKLTPNTPLTFEGCVSAVGPSTFLASSFKVEVDLNGIPTSYGPHDLGMLKVGSDGKPTWTPLTTTSKASENCPVGYRHKDGTMTIFWVDEFKAGYLQMGTVGKDGKLVESKVFKQKNLRGEMPFFLDEKQIAYVKGAKVYALDFAKVLTGTVSEHELVNLDALNALDPSKTLTVSTSSRPVVSSDGRYLAYVVKEVVKSTQKVSYHIYLTDRKDVNNPQTTKVSLGQSGDSLAPVLYTQEKDLYLSFINSGKRYVGKVTTVQNKPSVEIEEETVETLDNEQVAVPTK